MTRAEKREVRWHADQQRLEVRFPYRPDLVDRVREIGGGRFDRAHRSWWFAKERGDAVAAALAPLGFALDPEFFEDSDGPSHASAEPPWSVSLLNRNLRSALERSFPREVRVVAQVVRASGRTGGHLWLELADAEGEDAAAATIPAVAFAAHHALLEERLQTLGAVIEPGLVLCWIAEVTFFERAGRVQLRIHDVDLDWSMARLEDRRRQVVRVLTEEGHLGRNARLPFPLLPRRVAVVTSMGSDAWHDVLSTLSESPWPFEILPVDVRVQGVACVPSLLGALRLLEERREEFDVCLLTRGGGSRSDLAWWDDLALGRAVAMASFKIIVSVGHEQDRSVLDDVALSARTPTAGARLLVDRMGEAAAGVAACARRLERVVQRRLLQERRDLMGLSTGVARESRRVLEMEGRQWERWRRSLRPLSEQVLKQGSRDHRRLAGRVTRASRRGLSALRIALDEERARVSRERFLRIVRRAHLRLRQQAQRLARLGEGRREGERVWVQQAAGRVQRGSERALRRSRRAHQRDRETLNLLDPRRLLERGFTILRTADGRVVRDAQGVEDGQALRAELARGSLVMKVEERLLLPSERVNPAEDET